MCALNAARIKCQPAIFTDDPQSERHPIVLWIGARAWNPLACANTIVATCTTSLESRPGVDRSGLQAGFVYLMDGMARSPKIFPNGAQFIRG